MARSPRDVVRMHRIGRVRPTQRERASAGPPNDPGSPDRGRGRRHRREAAAPDPVNGRRNLLSRAGNRRSQRHERGVRILRPALHAHVTCLRCSRRRANRLTCSQVGMSERRAGQRPKGQARSRSHREDSLPHHLPPSVKDTCIRLCTPSGAFRQPSPPHGQASRRLSTRLANLVHGAAQNAALVRFGAQPALTTRGAAARACGSARTRHRPATASAGRTPAQGRPAQMTPQRRACGAAGRRLERRRRRAMQPSPS